MVKNFGGFWGSSRRKGLFLIPWGMKSLIPHIPHSLRTSKSDSLEELLFLEDPQMDFISQHIHFLSAWGT